jgi:hypothetical protein
MSNYLDNLIAFRVLYALTTPFDKTPAFKTGVIDATGNILVKADKRTPEQRGAYDVLDRLVFSLKRLLGKIPGGKSDIASLAAAYWLIREAHSNGLDTIDVARANMIFESTDSKYTAEQRLVRQYLSLIEDTGGGGGLVSTSPIANITGAGVSTDQPVVHDNQPVIRRNRKIKKFANTISEYRNDPRL